MSLHAPDDGLRDTLVPVNQRWNVQEVLDGAWNYAEATGRRVSSLDPRASNLSRVGLIPSATLSATARTVVE